MGNRSGARGAQNVGNLRHAAPVGGRTMCVRVAPVDVARRVVRVEDRRVVTIRPGAGNETQAGRVRAHRSGKGNGSAGPDRLAAGLRAGRISGGTPSRKRGPSEPEA